MRRTELKQLIREVMEESKSNDDQWDTVIAEIEQLEDDNDRAGVLKVIAIKVLKDRSLAKVIDAIATIHNYDGSLNSDLSDVRTRFTKSIKTRLQNEFGNELANKFL